MHPIGTRHTAHTIYVPLVYLYNCHASAIRFATHIHLKSFDYIGPDWNVFSLYGAK